MSKAKIVKPVTDQYGSSVIDLSMCKSAILAHLFSMYRGNYTDKGPIEEAITNMYDKHIGDFYYVSDEEFRLASYLSSKRMRFDKKSISFNLFQFLKLIKQYKEAKLRSPKNRLASILILLYGRGKKGKVKFKSHLSTSDYSLVTHLVFKGKRSAVNDGKGELCNTEPATTKKTGKRITKEHLIADYLSLKSILGRQPTKGEYVKEHHHYQTLDSVFGQPGYPNLVIAAGDVYCGSHGSGRRQLVTKDRTIELFLELEKKLGRQPKFKEYLKECHCDRRTINKHFGPHGWLNLNRCAGREPRKIWGMNQKETSDKSIELLKSLINQYKNLHSKPTAVQIVNLYNQNKLHGKREKGSGAKNSLSVFEYGLIFRLKRSLAGKDNDCLKEMSIRDIGKERNDRQTKEHLVDDYNKIGKAKSIINDIKEIVGEEKMVIKRGEKRLTKEHLIQDYHDLKKRVGRQPTIAEFYREHHHHSCTINSVFGRPGYRNLVKAAGDVYHDYRYTKNIVETVEESSKGRTDNKPSSGSINTVVNLSYRKEKFRIRRWLAEKSLNSGASLRCLTFPGSEWILERDLLIGGKAESIIGLEADKEIYEYSKMNIPYSDKVQLLNHLDKDYIVDVNKPSNDKRFNFVWLDYMGPFLPTKLDAITNLFKYRFVDDTALFALTFINGMMDYTSLYEKYGGKRGEDGTWNDARIETIPKILNAHAGEYGYELKTLKAEHYCEKQGNCRTSPMIFFAFQSTYNGGEQPVVDSSIIRKVEELRALGYTVNEPSYVGQMSQNL